MLCRKHWRHIAVAVAVVMELALVAKIHIEVCQWLLNGMIVAALLNLCGKIQTKCKLEKIW